MVVFWFIPAQDPLTPFGLRTLGALLGGVYGWITCDMVWPSFAAIASFALSGFTPTGNAALALVGGNTTMLYILALFVFAGIFVSSNTAPIIAQNIVAWKIARGRPWMLTLVLLIATFIPAIVVGGVPALLIAWNIVYAICDETGIQKGETWPTIMLIFIAFVGSCGYAILPIQVANAANIGYIASIAPSIKIPYGQFMIITMFYSILTIAGFMIYIKFIAKPDVSKLANYDNSKPVPKFNFQQKACLWLFLLLFVLLMLQGIIPGTAVGKYLANLGNCAVVVFVLAIAFMIKKDGKHIADFKTVCTGIAYTPLVMMATAMCIGSTFADKKTGINAWLGKIVGPIFSGMNPFILCIVIVVFALILANFVRGNTAAWVVQPIIFSFNKILPPGLMVATMIAIMCITPQAAILPPGSTNASLIYGNSEWLSKKDILKYVVAATVIVLITLLIATVGLGSVIL